MRTETVRQLRNGDRWWEPGGDRASAISLQRLVTAGALVTVMVGLAAIPARAAETPAPDPFPSQTTPAPTPAAQPAAPTPDPAPSAPEESSPSSTAPSSSAAAIQPDAAPPTQTSKPRPAPTSPRPAAPPPSASSGPASSRSWTGSPLKGLGKSAAALAAASATSPTDSTKGVPLLLSALALLALVLASGSLLHLLARADGLWGKA